MRPPPPFFLLHSALHLVVLGRSPSGLQPTKIYTPHYCPRTRIPNAAVDELDELEVEVEMDARAGAGAVGEARARAAATALLPTVRAKLEELAVAIRQYGTVQA